MFHWSEIQKGSLSKSLKVASTGFLGGRLRKAASCCAARFSLLIFARVQRELLHLLLVQLYISELLGFRVEGFWQCLIDQQLLGGSWD